MSLESELMQLEKMLGFEPLEQVNQYHPEPNGFEQSIDRISKFFRVVKYWILRR